MRSGDDVKFADYYPQKNILRVEPRPMERFQVHGLSKHAVAFLPRPIDSRFIVAEIELLTIKELTMNVFHPLAAITLAASVLTGAAHAQDVLRIGAPLPLTGALAPEGVRLCRWS